MKNGAVRGVAMLATVASVTAVVAGQSGPATASTLKWGACPDGVPRQVACSTLQVPLDYSEPEGRQITLTVSGIGSLSAKDSLLVNRAASRAAARPANKTQQTQRISLAKQVAARCNAKRSCSRRTPAG